MMKYFVLMILPGVLVSCMSGKSEPAQTATKDTVVVQEVPAPVTANDTTPPGFPLGNYENPSLVQQLYQWATQIDSLPVKDSIHLENEEFMENMTDGGGSVTGYFFHGQLVKIKRWIGFSYGIRDNSFYFKNGELIYVTELELNYYTDSTGTDHSRFSDTEFHGYYFFSGNKFVGEVSNGHNRFENDENDSEKEFLATAVQLQKLMRRYRKYK